MSGRTPGGDFRLLDGIFRESPVREVLPNGAVLVAREDQSSPIVSVQVWVKTGSIHEDALSGSGVSHFVEHMLFKGTERRAGREISATVQAHGGYINAYTTFDRTVYYIDVPAEHLRVALDILSDTVLNSTFPADEVAKEREVILREIDMGRDDPDSRFSELLFQTAFRTHPFRFPIIGHRDVFSALTRDDLVGYYRARYVPNNVVVVIVGAVPTSEISAAVRDTFGLASRKRISPVVIPPEPPLLAPRTAHRFEDVDVTRAALAWPIPGIAHPDAPGLDLLATVLGGGESAELWQVLREESRLVHAIDAYSWTPAEAGLFSISFVGEVAKRDEAAARIRELLADVCRRGFGDEEIARAKRQMIVGEINGRKTMSGQAGRLGVAETVAGELDYSRSYFARLETLDSGALVTLVQRYLISEHEIWVSQNPATAAPAAEVVRTAKTQASLSFERIDLPNGARLLLQENHTLPNVHLRLGALGSALVEEPGKRGATSLMATLLTKDTAKRSALEVAAAIEKVGGSFYPFSGNNSFGIAAEVLSADLGVALELMREAVASPRFDSRSFDVERDAQIAALRQDQDDIVSFTRRRLREAFFGAHPLAAEPGGRIQDLETLTPADLKRLWERCAVASNLVLTVVGDFEKATLVPELTKWFESLPKGRLEAAEPAHTGPAQAQAIAETLPREQAVVMLGFPGPGVHSEDFYVSEVADEIFSGMSSRLFERVREEKGLAYFVRSSRTIGLESGLFAFLAGTRPDAAAEVLAEMEAEIARIATEGPALEELQRCRTRLKAARKMGLQTNASRAMLALTNTLYGYPVNDWAGYDERIDAVSIEQLRDFAVRRLTAEKRIRLVVGP